MSEQHDVGKNLDLCTICRNRSFIEDDKFERTEICLKKYWMGKRYKLSTKNPVIECKLFNQEDVMFYRNKVNYIKRNNLGVFTHHFEHKFCSFHTGEETLLKLLFLRGYKLNNYSTKLYNFRYIENITKENMEDIIAIAELTVDTCVFNHEHDARWKRISKNKFLKLFK